MSGGGGVQSRECEESGHIASAALLAIDSIAGDPCRFRHEPGLWSSVEDGAQDWEASANIRERRWRPFDYLFSPIDRTTQKAGRRR